MTAMVSETADRGAPSGRSEDSDAQLLERFVTGGDHGAFAELVNRHGACVWSVCRRVLGHVQDAEDAFQAVFLILGRKAAAIRRRQSVGSWLYGVAFLTAMKVRRGAARRQARESRVAEAVPQPSPPEQAAARELQRLLDEEVARLAEKYRAPFVLCCLEGLTRGEAARELGWSEGTISSRLAQARALLQKRLARRGFTLGAALTACALTQIPAVPPALAQAAVQAGVAGKAAATFSPAVVALADNILHALIVTKLQATVALGLLLALATTAVALATFRMWPPAETLTVGTVPARPTEVWSVAVSPDGKLAAASAGRWDQPGELGLWDLASRKQLMDATESRGIASVAFSPDSRLLASASWTGDVRLRQVPSGEEVAGFKIPGVARVAFSPDGSLLAIASESRIVRLVDVARREVLADLKGDPVRFHRVVFSPDGKRLLAGGGDREPGVVGQVSIWDVASKRQVGKLLGHDLAVITLAVSPDGKTIATGGMDNMIRLWDAETGAERHVLRGHDHWVESVEFSRDGKTLVSGALDGTVRFWDVAQGRETDRFAFAGPATVFAIAADGAGPVAGDAVAWALSASVRAAHFTPDGAALLVGGGPRTLRLFDAATRKEIATLWGGPPPQSLLISTESTRSGRAVPAAGVLTLTVGAQRAGRDDGGADKVEAKGDPQPVPPPRAFPERATIAFGQGLDGLRLFGTGVEAMAKVEPEGLRFTLPAERETHNEVGAAVPRTLSGDFEITLAYDLLAVPEPGPEWGAGAVLEAEFNTPDSAWVRLSRTQKRPGAYFGSTYYARGEDGKKVSQSLSYPRADAKLRTGRLRLSRTGTELAFQVEEGDGGFRTIATKEVGGADVVSVRAMATSGFRPFPIDLRFTDLDLRWAPETKIAAPPAAAPPRPRGGLAGAVGVAAVVFLLVATGLLAVRRHRRAHGRSPGEVPAPPDAIALPPVTIECPECQRKLRLKAGQAGKNLQCPHCAATIPAPAVL